METDNRESINADAPVVLNVGGGIPYAMRTRMKDRRKGSWREIAVHIGRGRAIMKFWDDTLHICPRCKEKIHLHQETKAPCPKCGETVWFYNHRKLKPPPEIPTPETSEPWRHPLTVALLAVNGIFGIVVLLSFANSAVVAVVCALACIGFGVFGFLRHAETLRFEQRLAHAEQLEEYSQLMRERLRDSVSRYNSLIRVGDERIEEYFERIYLESVKEKMEAEELRKKSAKDLAGVQTIQVRIDSMAERFLQDHRKWVSSKLRADPDSYQRHKNTLGKSFDFVESVGYTIPSGLRKSTLDDLKTNYREKVREQALKDEQKRIKAQMREEARIEREQQKEIRESEDRERELQRRLQEALRDQAGEHASEIDDLQRQLAEAQANSERAKSMAQLTKAGHVYILSNIGTFGEDVFKVGMTRRLDPADRVKELGDASVPFPFDVHAMVSCDNAPGLENALHRELTRYRVNRVNLRKEYFSVDLKTILDAVRRNHGDIDYVAEYEALEFRESQTISPDDLVTLTEELTEMGVDISEDDEALVGQH